MIQINYSNNFLRLFLSILLILSVQSKLQQISVELPHGITAADVVGWQVLINNVAQGTMPIYTDCYLGSVFGLFGKNTVVQKTYNNLPPHWSISVSVSAQAVWEWDDDFKFSIDNQLIYSRNWDNGDAAPRWRDTGDGYEQCAGGQSDRYYGYYVPLSLNTTHVANSATLKFHPDVSQGNIYKQAWMINDVHIHVDTCHESCLTCDGPSYKDCTSCPAGAADYSAGYKQCRCPLGQIAQNHACVVQATCPAGFEEDFVTRTCIDLCPIDFCTACNADRECTNCQAGYKLMKGFCYDKCPFYTTDNGNSCTDATWDSFNQPILVAEDFINQRFTHAEVAKGDYTIDKEEYNTQGPGLKNTNYAYNACAQTFVMGMGFQSGNCNPKCGLSKTFKVPPHYRVAMKLWFFFGDSWNDETYHIRIDGTSKHSEFFDYTGVSYGLPHTEHNNDICGVFDRFTDAEETVEIAPYNHNSETLDLSIDWRLNSNTWNEWGGFREMAIYVEACTAPNVEWCRECNSSNTGCSKCITSRTNTPNCNQPDDGYYDDGSVPQPLEFPKCENKCVTCNNPGDDCIICTDASATPPTCGKYTNCLRQVRVESGNQDHGNYHRVFFDTVDQNVASSRGMGLTLFTAKGEFLEYINYNTADVLADTNAMVAKINSLAAGQLVMVGIFEEGSYELNPPAYEALESLGMSSDTVLDLFDGFAMIGEKGSAPGSATQRHVLRGDLHNKAHVEQCLIDCIGTCAECENRNDNCIRCDPPRYLHYDTPINSCVITCPAGEYPVDTPDRECIDCTIGCTTCTSDTVCTSCDPGYYMHGTMCVDPCPDGFWPRDFDQTCQPCHGTCETCDGGTDLDCIICQDNPQHYLHLVDGKCYADCPDPYYEDDTTNPKQCSECDTVRCTACFGPSNQECTACTPEYILTPPNECKLICNPTCGTCQEFPDDKDICLSCDPPLFLLGTQCVNCPGGMYGDAGPPRECKDCPTECATCTSPAVCQSCEPGWYLHNNQCINPCPDGYWANDNTRTCDLCHNTCETCSDGTDTGCIICQDNPQHYRHYGDNKCYADCPAVHPETYYEDDTTDPKQCSLCDTIRCTKCFGPTNFECTACTPEYQLTAPNECKLICNPTCATCQEFPDDKDICLSCDPPLFLHQNKCISCPDGMFGNIDPLTGERTCQDCPVECATCISLDVCLTCEPGWFLKDGKCLDPCPDGWYGDENTWTCEECQPLCKTCEFAMPMGCTSCFADQERFLENHQCKRCDDDLGYDSDPNDYTVCLEICGDGIRVDPDTGCDDGNLIDGDGCSSQCTVETGYKCEGGTSYSRDICVDISPIRFIVFQSDSDQTFLNIDKNHVYYFQIRFSKPFSLPLDQSLEEYIQISIEGHPSSDYKVKIYNNPNQPDEYTVALEFNTTIRQREIKVDFADPQRFIDENKNTLQNRAQYVSVNHYFHYTDEQRQETKDFKFWIRILIIIMFIYIWPLVILDKYWIMTNCLDNMQLIFLISFINFRQPINGLSFVEEIKAYQNFYLPNPFNYSEQNSDVSRTGKFEYWNYSPHFLDNVGPLFLSMLFFMTMHIIARIVISLPVNWPKQSEQVKRFVYKPAFWLVHEFYETRFMNDFWNSTVGIFITFASLNYEGLKLNISAFLSFIFGIAAIAITFYTALATFRCKNKDFDREKTELEDRIKDKGYQFRNFWGHLKKEKGKINQYWITLIQGRKLFYAFILVHLHRNIIAQFVMLISMSVIYLLYIGIMRPFKRHSDNIRVFLTEFVTFIGMCLSIKMRIDVSEDEVQRYNDTWGIIWCFVVSLIIHDLFLLYDTWYALYVIISNYCFNRKKYKVTNLREKRNTIMVDEKSSSININGLALNNDDNDSNILSSMPRIVTASDLSEKRQSIHSKKRKSTAGSLAKFGFRRSGTNQSIVTTTQTDFNSPANSQRQSTTIIPDDFSDFTIDSSNNMRSNNSFINSNNNNIVRGNNNRSRSQARRSQSKRLSMFNPSRKESSDSTSNASPIKPQSNNFVDASPVSRKSFKRLGSSTNFNNNNGSFQDKSKGNGEQEETEIDQYSNNRLV